MQKQYWDVYATFTREGELPRNNFDVRSAENDLSTVMSKTGIQVMRILASAAGITLTELRFKRMPEHKNRLMNFLVDLHETISIFSIRGHIGDVAISSFLTDLDLWIYRVASAGFGFDIHEEPLRNSITKIDQFLKEKEIVTVDALTKFEAIVSEYR